MARIDISKFTRASLPLLLLVSSAAPLSPAVSQQDDAPSWHVVCGENPAVGEGRLCSAFILKPGGENLSFNRMSGSPVIDFGFAVDGSTIDPYGPLLVSVDGGRPFTLLDNRPTQQGAISAVHYRDRPTILAIEAAARGGHDLSAEYQTRDFQILSVDFPLTGLAEALDEMGRRLEAPAPG